MSLLLVAETQLGDAEQSEVCDDDFSILQEYILRLQILVHDAPSVQVTHALQYYRYLF